jgi:putative ABC transport system ATP-binding protein
MASVLKLKDVSRIYGEGRTAVEAVDNVSLAVKPGEIVLIMGPSGSGKTTLLSLAGLLLTPTSGAIWLDNQMVNELPARELPQIRLRKIGFVFQAYNLLSALTSRENVELVLNLAGTRGVAARERATTLLSQLGLAERLDHKPSDLSGGEKQRVAIARALANDPKLILADEPTGNLDSKTGRAVMDLLCNDIGLDRGRSMVIVTHDHRLTAIADRVLWLEDGRLTSSNQPVAAWSGAGQTQLAAVPGG